jgi:hypothetical protein
MKQTVDLKAGTLTIDNVIYLFDQLCFTPEWYIAALTGSRTHRYTAIHNFDKTRVVLTRPGCAVATAADKAAA